MLLVIKDRYNVNSQSPFHLSLINFIIESRLFIQLLKYFYSSFSWYSYIFGHFKQVYCTKIYTNNWYFLHLALIFTSKRDICLLFVANDITQHRKQNFPENKFEYFEYILNHQNFVISF